MIKLSVVIITYNEEKNIERCLLSVRTVADEIVVVDSFSTDRTKEICERHEVNFLQNTFEGHIQQKNFAMLKASNDFVLSLDADEELSEELSESIKLVKNNWTSDGYMMNRLSNYCGKWIKHSGWYPDKKLRLFDRRKGKWGGTNPHDKFEGSGSIGYLKGDIKHYTFYSVGEHLKQVESFTDIAAKEACEKGKTAGFVRIWIYPAIRFLQWYVFGLGFLDGYYGWKICTISAKATHLKYAKLQKLYRSN